MIVRRCDVIPVKQSIINRESGRKCQFTRAICTTKHSRPEAETYSLLDLARNYSLQPTVDHAKIRDTNVPKE